MKTICLLNIWMGKLPENFAFWRLSAEKNESIDFFIITDQEGYTDSSNIHFVYMTFGQVRERFQRLFPFKIKLRTPYKLCDYKPVYAEAFPEIVADYEFWGLCDLDLVFGDIRKFVSDDILEKYDKVLEAGNLTFFRNKPEMNQLYKRSADSDNMAYSYKKAFRCNYPCYLDEYMGLNILTWKYLDDRVFRDQTTERIVQDFSWERLDFHSYVRDESFVFCWKGGKLFRYLCDDFGEILPDQIPSEYAMAHIQKRKMAFQFDVNAISDLSEIWIVPGAYMEKMPEGPLYTDEDKKEYRMQYQKRNKKRMIKSILTHGVLGYIPHFFRRRRIVKWLIAEKGFF